MTDSKTFLGKTVTIVVDRPLGSKHPKYDFEYLANYGYVPGTISSDGEELDAYILGIEEPLAEYTGRCIAVIHRINDDDDKLVILPEGIEMTDEEIRMATYFQERWFESVIIRQWSNPRA